MVLSVSENVEFFVRVYRKELNKKEIHEEVMRILVNQGQLMSYMHKGFWQCMDTHREHLELESMWENGDAPWKVWED